MVIFEHVDACVSPVLTLEESLAHANTVARGMVAEVSGGGATTTQYALPIRMTDFDFAVRRGPPLVGEHNGEVVTGEVAR
jgi:crotonobetainyl-CoA:carnitine CoA-transferase CaiB-like acyl-CoA transferase